MATQTKRQSVLLKPELLNRVRKTKEVQDKKAGGKMTLQSFVESLIEKGLVSK